MSNPSDGMAVYEAADPLFGTGYYQPRLAQIAAGGFSLVINYNLLVGHISDIISYINTAASVGLKVIVALNDPAIWLNGTYATSYPQLYADAGNPGTGTAFMQYIVAQVKSLAGVWGYYVADEITAANHTTLHTYAAAIATADSTHPRLVIESASDNTQSVASGSNIFYDCAEIIGDDWYPLGDTQTAWTTPAVEAAGIQTYATAHSVLPAMALQCFSWTQYYPPARANNWPASAPWPSAVQMRYNRDQALAQGTLKVMLWYTYYNLFSADDPGTHWTDLCWAANGVGTQPVEPSILAESLMYAYANQSGWQTGWSHATGTLTASIASGIGNLTGSTDANIFLLGSGSTLPATSSYVTRFALSNATTGSAGVVFNYVDANNYLVCKSVSNTTIQLVSVVAGTPTTIGSAGYAVGSGNRQVLKVVDTGTSYKVLIYNDTSTIEPSTLFTVAHSTTATRTMRYGAYAQLGTGSDTASVYHFAAFNLNPSGATSPVYYVAQTGNDSNPGTQYQPFATIGQAASVVTPGALVIVQPGTYTITSEIQTPVAGTPTQRIQFIANGAVNVHGSGVSILWGCQGNYVDIIGFDISGDASASIGFVFYGAYNTLQHCTIHDLTHASSIALEDFTFPAANNQVISCTIKNISSNSAAAFGVRWQSSSETVVNTQIFQTGQGVQTTGSSTTIANNLIAACSAGGILVWGNATAVDSEIVSNNILYKGTGGYAIREIGTTGTHSTYTDNLLLGNLNGILLQNGNTATGTVTSDPGFANYQPDGSGDYHYGVSSPCVNAGTSNGAPSSDFDNIPRPQLGGYDIGPYEAHELQAVSTVSRDNIIATKARGQ